MSAERPERDRTDLGLSVLPEPESIHRCRRGWIGDEDHPAPCPICRPHLTRDGEGWAVHRASVDRKAPP